MMFKKKNIESFQNENFCAMRPWQTITRAGHFMTWGPFFPHRYVTVRCAEWVSGGCLHSGWEPRIFTCGIEFKIIIVNDSEFISNFVKDKLCYFDYELSSDLSCLDDVIKSVLHEIFDCFEVSFNDFKNSLKMQNYILDNIIRQSQSILKKMGINLLMVSFKELTLLEKGYDSIGKGYGVYPSYGNALSADIPDIDNGKTVEDTLRQLLDAGLITQKMFDEKMEKI